VSARMIPRSRAWSAANEYSSIDNRRSSSSSGPVAQDLGGAIEVDVSRRGRPSPPWWPA
jgi:hypothetical protein